MTEIIRGPCAKRRVTCILINANRDQVAGENDCANPQATCPRAPGEGYEKCKSVCGQAGHAETEAIARAQRLGMDLTGASAHIHGHYHACEPCARALAQAGVSWIVIHVDQTAVPA